VTAAAKAGWDSLQFTRHCDAFCDGTAGIHGALRGQTPESQLCPAEVVLTGVAGAPTCPTVALRRGLGAAEPCQCKRGGRSQRGACAVCRG